ncbi:hypothetical protein ACQP1W_29970 [Spirillospora sp. CA-255316]
MRRNVNIEDEIAVVGQSPFFESVEFRRSDLNCVPHELDGGKSLAVDLRTLTTRRADPVADRTRQVNGLPALERALEPTDRGPLVLLTGYQTPAAI